MTWANAKIKHIYVGENLVRPPNPYTPTSNTLAYFPFKDDQLDKVGNCTLSATWTKQTIWYRFTSGSSTLWITIPSNKQTSRFYSCRIKGVTIPSWYYDNASTMMTNYWTMRFFYKYQNQDWHTKQFWYWKDSSNIVWSNTQTIDLTNWFHLAYWCDSSNNYKWWINWNLVFSGTATSQRYYNSVVWFQPANSTIDYSDFILENRLWTATEVTNYYNKTKSNYWL